MFSCKFCRSRFRLFGRLLIVLLSYVFVAGLFCGQAQAADAVLGATAAKTIPIVDAHFHVLKWMNGGELLEHMDRNGIRWAGGVGGNGVEAISYLGTRFIRPTGMGQWHSLHANLDSAAFENPNTPEVKKVLSLIEADLHDRGARAIGEIHVNALTTTREPSNRYKTKGDSPTLKALFDLAGKYNRILNIHAQWDSGTPEEVERLAASNRSARLVLSHCGYATDSDIRGVFERHANVSCDLSARGIPPLQGPKYAIFDERGIDGNWKKLIEDYPDRFVVGIDTVMNWEEYEGILRAIRLGVLANLSPETAEKVAYKNAQSWFGLK
jgi:hypothetical protein